MKTRFRSRAPLWAPSGFAGGFTLIELLVVVAIVAILVALALVGTRAALQSSYAAQTVSNLRALQMANLQFAADNDDFFVPNWPEGVSYGMGGWWRWRPYLVYLGAAAKDGSGGNLIPSYGNADFPKVARTGKPVRIYNWGADSPPKGSYGIVINGQPGSHTLDGKPNPNLGWADTHWLPSKIKRTAVRSPSKFIIFFEGAQYGVGSYVDRFAWRDAMKTFKPGATDEPSNRGVAFRHKGKRAHAVAADGHVFSFTDTDPLVNDTRYWYHHHEP